MSWSDEPEIEALEKSTLLKILDKGESEIAEFLPEVTDEVELAKLAVCFANHKGGVILIGVDKTGTAIGLEDVDSVKLQVGQALEEFTQGDFAYRLFTYEMDSVRILEIRILKYDRLPCAVEGRFYQWSPNPGDLPPLPPRRVKKLILDQHEG